MDLVMRAERRPSAGETLQGEFGMYLGGKGFNQAIASRRLGAEVAVIGRVGDDEFGRQFIAALGREGIDARAVRVDAVAGTGVASIIVEPDGANAILQAPRANRQLSASDIASAGEAFAGADVAMLQLETSMEAAQAFALAARAHAATVLLNPAPASAVPAELLALTDVLVPNEIEAKTLTGIRIETIEDAHAAAGALQARGPRIVVITLGSRGAVSADHDIRTHHEGHPVAAVDTVGAGDAFCAALAVALGEGETLVDAVAFANAAGAAATMRHGAEPSMPTRREVAAVAAKGAQR